MRKVGGLFYPPKSEKEVNHNDKTENPRPAPSRKGASRDAACTGTAQAGASGEQKEKIPPPFPAGGKMLYNQSVT